MGFFYVGHKNSKALKEVSEGKDLPQNSDHCFQTLMIAKIRSKLINFLHQGILETSVHNIGLLLIQEDILDQRNPC